MVFNDERLLNLLIQYNPWWKGLPLSDKITLRIIDWLIMKRRNFTS